MTEVKVILVHTSDKLLEQIDEELGKFAFEKLKVKWCRIYNEYSCCWGDSK